jgi:hypothetical protein
MREITPSLDVSIPFRSVGIRGTKVAHFRGQHVDSTLLHVRRMHPTLDRVFPGRLENDLHHHIRSSGSGDGCALVGTGEREVAR